MANITVDPVCEIKGNQGLLYLALYVSGYQGHASSCMTRRAVETSAVILFITLKFDFAYSILLF